MTSQVCGYRGYDVDYNVNGVTPDKQEGIGGRVARGNGFQGFVALIDPEHGRSIGYSVWDSAADLAAGETRGNYQQQIGKLGGVLAGPPVREVYEVTVVA